MYPVKLRGFVMATSILMYPVVKIYFDKHKILACLNK